MKKVVLAAACVVTACSALPPSSEPYGAGPGVYREHRAELYPPRPPAFARPSAPRPAGRQMVAAVSGRTTAGGPASRATPVAAHGKAPSHGSNR